MLLNPFDAVKHALRMAMGCVNNQDVDTGINQQLDTFFRTGSDADSSTGKQFAVFVFGSIRMFGCFDDVFDVQKR